MQREQVDQALDLLAEWEKMSTIDINDALQMLSADFTHPKVRMAAARRIAVADDNELVGYLLQLVQALRYEPVASDAPANDSLLNLLGRFPAQRHRSPFVSPCPTRPQRTSSRLLLVYVMLIGYVHGKTCDESIWQWSERCRTWK